MNTGRRRSGKFLVGLLVVLGLAGSLGWVERMTLLAWFRVRLLARADESNREARAAQVAALGDAALPDLLACLRRPDPDVCRNARAGLAALAETGGGLAGGLTTDLTHKLAREYPRLGVAGQQQVLEMVAEWFRGTPAEPAPNLMLACAHLLAAAAGAADPGVQGAALDLCALLVAHPRGAETLSAGREVVRTGLQSANPAVRLRAVMTSQHRGMDLLEPVAGLLNDPAAEVRRAAIVVVGPATEVVLDETLLPCLRDPDPGVRKLAELVLTNDRGLKREHLELGRLLNDPSPTMRLQILGCLRRIHDIDPGVWLRRLSHDPAPSVRAAAVRVMSQQTLVDLTDRIDQMAQSDPSPTVSALASYWLKHCTSRTVQP